MSADNKELDMRPRLAVDGPCPSCNKGTFHTEGCPVIPRDRELLHLRAEVRQKVEVIHDFLAVQPREWTAETIAGAPEGGYHLAFANDDSKGDHWDLHFDNCDDDIPNAFVRYSKTEAIQTMKDYGSITRFFGPIPQPPIHGDHDGREK